MKAPLWARLIDRAIGCTFLVGLIVVVLVALGLFALGAGRAARWILGALA